MRVSISDKRREIFKFFPRFEVSLNVICTLLRVTKHSWIIIHDYTMCYHAFSCTAMYLPVLTVLIENCGHAKRVLTGYFNTAAEIFLRVYHYNYIFLCTEHEFSIFWERLSMSFSPIFLWRKHVFKKHDIIHRGVFLSQEPLAKGAFYYME